MDELTFIQREVLKSLRRRADSGEAAPTYRDLCLEFGWSSTGTIRDHLRALSRKGYLTLAGGRARLVKLTNSAPVVRIPLIGRAIAGSPVLAEQTSEERIPVPEEWLGSSAGFALEVYGDSMIDVGIFDGDIVIARRQATASDRDIVVALVDGESTLKRFRNHAGRTILAAENKHYSDIEVDLRNVVIHGVVVGLLRRFTSIGLRSKNSTKDDLDA